MFKNKRIERKNRENGKRNEKKIKGTNEIRIAAVQKKNTTYGGINFVPTSEVCVVPSYRSS